MKMGSVCKLLQLYESIVDVKQLTNNNRETGIEYN